MIHLCRRVSVPSLSTKLSQESKSAVCEHVLKTDSTIFVGKFPDLDMSGREEWMRSILTRREKEGTLRELQIPEQDGCFVDFTSNDYLGLGRATDLRQAVEREERRALQVCARHAEVKTCSHRGTP